MTDDDAVDIALESENNRDFFEDAAAETDDSGELPLPRRRVNPKKTKPPAATPKKTNEERNVEELAPYHLQAELPATSAAEDAELLADIKRNGMLDRIEILPDGTIISGHRRWEAARKLGKETVRVVVRPDLAAKGADAVERRFLEANLNRRHLTNVQKARIFKRLRELAPKGTNRRGQGNVRDEVAGILGMSGRNLERWETLLDAPAEIVAAVERKQLPLARAVELLDADEGEHVDAVIERVQGGESARTVVNEVLGTAKPAKPTAREAAKKFTTWLRAGCAFAENAAALRKNVTDDDVESIRELIALLRGLLGSAERGTGGKQNKTTNKRKPR